MYSGHTYYRLNLLLRLHPHGIWWKLAHLYSLISCALFNSRPLLPWPLVPSMDTCPVVFIVIRTNFLINLFCNLFVYFLFFLIRLFAGLLMFLFTPSVPGHHPAYRPTSAGRPPKGAPNENDIKGDKAREPIKHHSNFIQFKCLPFAPPLRLAARVRPGYTPGQTANTKTNQQKRKESSFIGSLALFLFIVLLVRPSVAGRHMRFPRLRGGVRVLSQLYTSVSYLLRFCYVSPFIRQVPAAIHGDCGHSSGDCWRAVSLSAPYFTPPHCPGLGNFIRGTTGIKSRDVPKIFKNFFLTVVILLFVPEHDTKKLLKYFLLLNP